MKNEDTQDPQRRLELELVGTLDYRQTGFFVVDNNFSNHQTEMAGH